MKKILTVSSANMDLSMKLVACPEKGQTVMGKEYAYVPGGKGANSAVTVAKLGGGSVFCAALGRDANGDALNSYYENLGIDTSCILRTDEAPTGLATVAVEADGANRITVFSGANSVLNAEYAVSCVKNVMPDAVFCHFEIPFDTVLAVSRICYELKIPLFIDAGPADASYPLEKLSPMTVFSPNETETELFTGIDPSDPENALAAARKLSELVKARYYVIKLGKRGVGVYDGKDLILIPTYDVKVVDTTAAGDSFTAAMTFEYVRSGDIYRACRYGNAVASLTVSKRGAGDSVPTAKEVSDFITERSITL